MEKTQKSTHWRYRTRFNGMGFLFGIFLALWGVSELLGDIYWWATPEFLWPVFLMFSGILILVGVFERYRYWEM